ncbi:MAG TPA: hybrid sensor histidine kinase/response regulator [Roseiflexaceae bacterium]|nr:hybrid sensor histidine kinase/response regulator [Roseiflexaceae bacterium]
MDLTAFYSQFRDETAENIRILNEGLLVLEALGPGADGRREHIDAMFRAMHTIKGSARMLGFEQVGRVAHTCEHILGAVREGRRELDRALADDMLRAGDAIVDLVNTAIDGHPSAIDVEALTLTLGRGGRSEAPAADVDAPAPEPPAANAPITPAPVATAAHPGPPEPAAVPAFSRTARTAARQTIRVRVDRLDKLLNLAGELAVGRQAQAVHLQTLGEIATLIDQQERMLLALERQLRQLRFSHSQREALERHMNGALNAGDQASKLIRAHTERFEQHAGHTTQLVEDLEQEVMAARLLPISTVYANLPRAVRELARDTDKAIELILLGETTELDRKMIEALNDPLIHLIRNAVDHGIEMPDEREQAGKPRQGTITVSAEALGAYVNVTIRDDGRGMDPKLLREAAVRKNLFSAEATALLTDQEALELIFTPGFSTAQMITDISGRGVGMDVVRTNIVELGGQVHVDSRLCSGTSITLALPMTLVTTRVLLVELGEYTFALPASSCQASIWAYAEQVQTIEGRAMLSHEGKLASLLRLADLLDVDGAQPFPSRRRTPAIVIGAAQRPLALLVDRLIDEREVVVKPLGPLLEKQRRFSGAIQMGDGRLVLLLNPVALAQAARGMALMTTLVKHDDARRHSRLLVADDSFTTRELIRTILQSAGYDVTTAVDGFDALDKLRAATYDLVVSDVEMPRVDGFQLTSRIRNDLGLTELPVIIVTSLASESHRRRGLEVGAQAYIVKSQFNQSNLLDTVQQLLGN